MKKTFCKFVFLGLGLGLGFDAMASTDAIKEEFFRPLQYPVKVEAADYQGARRAINEVPVVEISSSSSSGHVVGGNSFTALAGEVTSPMVSKRSNNSISSHNRNANGVSLVDPAAKRPRIESNGVGFASGDMRNSPARIPERQDASLPDDFLQPLEEIHGSPPSVQAAPAPMVPSPSFPYPGGRNTDKVSRQFWKAGDYESDKVGHKSVGGGMDHVRVHPKFLHSNATSHKWALGAIAELLDNALDEVVHGATFVKVDMIRSPRNGEPMLLIEDDGGGMYPDSMRQCMSLGYSAKSKIANTIGQYGNGFKTSTMRLGADVIVFSRCQDCKGSCPTESIGMLSYTFLRETGQEDIIVPMIDYEIQRFGLRKLIRSNVEDWNRNMESIKRWSPYSTESELLNHFKGMKSQGTKIIVFNLWEDDQGQLELDFDTNRHDIQVRGANRDEKHISMAERFPNSRHYLTYQHSLRSYASILYLRLPPGFRMFLRGKEIEHHNLIDDLMYTQVSTYRPVASDVQRDTGQMKAVVTVGFVKDAKEHIDVQGFNVYHKNRLIKPFWRLWNSAASRGRGIIGVLEANFVEPAHDKQGFERTIVLARLEARLLEMQKTYWSKNCHKVGYVNNNLKDKDGKWNHRGPSSSRAERSPELLGNAVHPAPAELPNVGVSLPSPRSLHMQTPEPPRPPLQVGFLPGAHATPIVPVGLARSLRSHTQVQLVARQEHALQEAHLQVRQQSGSQAFPIQSASASSLSHRHKEFIASTGEETEVPVPAFSSALPNGLRPQSQERPQGQFYNAIRSPIPLPVSSSLLQSRLQPELVRQGLLSHGVSSLGDSLQPQDEQISLALTANRVPPIVRSPPCNSDGLSGLGFVAEGPQSYSTATTGLQDSIRNAKAQACGVGVEAVNLHTPEVPSESAEEYPLIFFKENEGSRSHLVQESLVSAMQVSIPLPAAERVLEVSKSPAGVCTSSAAESIGKMQSQTDDCLQRQNGQGLSNAGAFTSFNTEKSIMQSTSQGVYDSSASPSLSAGTHFTNLEQHLGLAGEAGEGHGVGNVCTAVVGPSKTSSNLPSARIVTDGIVPQRAHILPEQSPAKASKLSNKDLVLGRKSLEDLGRMFAKKAALIGMNQGVTSINSKKGEGPVVHSIEASMKSIMTNCSHSTNRDLEACLEEMELEVQTLQQRLEKITVERDSLRQQLLEERIQGQLSKEELQKKVEQTWAKVRELETQNNCLRLVQQ